MPFELEIRQLAAKEIVDAFDWYESQKPGLGQAFLGALEDVFNTILQKSAYIFFLY